MDPLTFFCERIHSLIHSLPVPLLAELFPDMGFNAQVLKKKEEELFYAVVSRVRVPLQT
jgi:hypothetical protein